MNHLDKHSLQRALPEEQAARYCGISASKLKNGRIKTPKSELDVPRHTKIGKRVVYLRDDLDVWLEQCRAATDSGSVS
jgi:predicted DNA-binding transcriptional regulator AlpA